MITTAVRNGRAGPARIHPRPRCTQIHKFQILTAATNSRWSAPDFTFELLLFAPVGSAALHGLHQLDEEGDPLVDVLAAVRVPLDSVVVPVDLQSPQHQSPATTPQTHTHTHLHEAEAVGVSAAVAEAVQVGSSLRLSGDDGGDQRRLDAQSADTTPVRTLDPTQTTTDMEVEQTHTGSNTHFCPTLVILSLNSSMLARSFSARISEASVPGTSGTVINDRVPDPDTIALEPIMMFADVELGQKANRPDQ